MRRTPTWSGAKPPSRITWDGTNFGILTGKETHPVILVSFYGSAAYANWRSAMQGKLLAYNCSPSFNWRANMDDATLGRFQNELAAMGYKFQFVTLAGFHTLNLGMFDLAMSYRKEGMKAYSKFQEEEFKHGKEVGYMAITHQKFVGVGYFDRVLETVTGGKTATGAMNGSTEEKQF